MHGNEKNNIYVKIRFLYPSLTKSECVIADMILNEQEQFAKHSLSECAKIVGCSELTVIRFCKRLGLNGFIDLKNNVEDIALYAYDNAQSRVKAEDSLCDIFEKIIWYYNQTLKDTLSLYSNEYECAYQAIRDAKTINFFGLGDANVVCREAQVKFLRIGIPCTAFSDLTCMLSTASTLGKGDVAIGISFSGETKSVVDCIRTAHENGATTIGIVHFEKQPLSRYTDINLYTATIDLTDAHEEIARRIAESAILDTFYMKLVTEQRERYRKISQKTLATIIANKK